MDTVASGESEKDNSNYQTHHHTPPSVAHDENSGQCVLALREISIVPFRAKYFTGDPIHVKLNSIAVGINGLHFVTFTAFGFDF
jgi:hypothetical protein